MAKKIVIIGGGPAGYVAAIRAAQLGAETHIIEAEKLGGACLNVGCIPTKALMHTSELYHLAKSGASFGVKVGEVSLDWNAAMNNKQRIVNRLVKGVESLLKANKVNIHKGKARIKDPKTVVIEADPAVELSADAIVIATGSEPVKLKLPGADLPGVIDSTGALKLPSVPKSLAVIGGGVIGIEFAALYNTLGAKVTVVELLPEILPPVDREIAVKLRQQLEKAGVEFMTGAGLKEIRQTDSGLLALVAQGDMQRELSAEYVLIGVGRVPNTSGLGLESLGVAVDRGRIQVNAAFETNITGLYAIGDCNGLSLLAHAASAQGIAAIEGIMGHKSSYFGNLIPSCIYTSPEIGAVGLTEEAAEKQGLNVKVGRFPLSGNGKSLIENGGIGLVKIIAGAKHGEIIGVHIIGPRATEIIAEACLAMRLEATLDELVSTIHAHPTVSESIAEAALAADGLAIHWPPGMPAK